jgi:hypothetical protein
MKEERTKPGIKGCMNIGSVLYRLSPVQGTYRPINHEYI